ncbi:hypothetical protein [Geothrix oryzae]|uniref:hypothetical protein n=1 Tax=Geothrix oryzae TaxID=2927975 RepID=UPI0025738B9A|nr:hypothetical protein [Geothrix oryzae]
MNPEELSLKVPDSEFLIELSGFMLFFKRFLQLGAALVLMSGVYDSLHLHTLRPLITSLFNGGIYLALATFAIRTFPRKVSLEGDSVVFHQVPTTWINIGPILVPLGITQRVVHSKSAVTLEWIDRSLTLNDLNEGKSIPLASGKHADHLASWFSSIGVPNPVGG